MQLIRGEKKLKRQVCEAKELVFIQYKKKVHDAHKERDLPHISTKKIRSFK